MRIPVSFMAFSLSASLAIFSPIGGIRTTLAIESQPAVKATSMRLYDDHLHVYAHGQGIKIPRTLLKQWRVYHNELQIRLDGGTVVTMKLEDSQRPDTPWSPVAAPTNSAQSASTSRQFASFQDEEGREKARDRIDHINQHRRAYQSAYKQHKKRMHEWFSLMERAKSEGIQSSAINNEAIYETRQLSKQFDEKLAQYRRNLAHLEQTALQIAGGGRTPELVKQFNHAHAQAGLLAQELAQAGRALEDNLAANAAIINAELQQ